MTLIDDVNLLNCPDRDPRIALAEKPRQPGEDQKERLPQKRSGLFVHRTAQWFAQTVVSAAR